MLEIACGTGMIFLQMLSEGIDIYGLDIADPMLNVLLKKADVIGLADVKEILAGK